MPVSKIDWGQYGNIHDRTRFRCLRSKKKIAKGLRTYGGAGGPSGNSRGANSSRFVLSFTAATPGSQCDGRAEQKSGRAGPGEGGSCKLSGALQLHGSCRPILPPVTRQRAFFPRGLRGSLRGRHRKRALGAIRAFPPNR